MIDKPGEFIYLGQGTEETGTEWKREGEVKEKIKG